MMGFKTSEWEKPFALRVSRKASTETAGVSHLRRGFVSSDCAFILAPNEYKI